MSSECRLSSKAFFFEVENGESKNSFELFEGVISKIRLGATLYVSRTTYTFVYNTLIRHRPRTVIPQSKVMICARCI